MYHSWKPAPEVEVPFTTKRESKKVYDYLVSIVTNSVKKTQIIQNKLRKPR